MSENKISAVIVTLNEEKNIGRCLASLQGVVDEIVVLDSFSTDDTEKICSDHGVLFIQRPWQDYSKNKNYANAQAKYDFILSIDADEVLSDDLKSSLMEIKKSTLLDGYYLNRKTNYCGQWIKHCGWYPDSKLRLWNRTKGSWQGAIHEEVILDEGSTTSSISGDLLHYSFYSIQNHLDTANHFSKIAAEDAYKSGITVNFVLDIFLNPIFTFIKKYIFQLGFLDGYYGFVICRISAFSNFLKYIKIKELHENKGEPDPH